MTIKILRPLTKKHGKSIYPNVHDVQIVLQRGINLGISLDTMYGYLTEREKMFVERFIINYEFKTLKEYANSVGKSPDRIGQMTSTIYRKLRNCILNKFLINFCRREFGLYEGEFKEYNRFGEAKMIKRYYKNNEIANELFDDLVNIQDDTLKQLSKISNHIYLELTN